MGKILQAIQNGSKRIILQGSAGVGKTYLVNEILKNISISNYSLVYLAAPTNKALAVLREKTIEKDNTCFSTIHSALKLKRRFNNDTGEVFFRQEYKTGDEPFKNCQLLIVDESSMLNEELIDHLKDYNFPILFIGDNKQLNPVNEDYSPVFHKNWLTFELTEIIRQGEGNPIITLSRDLALIGNKQEILHNDTGFIYTYNRAKIIDKLADVNGTDELKYLAWTNVEIDTINYSVRHKIYDNPGMIERGEVLVFNAPYGDSFYTNQELKIVDLDIINKHFESPLGDVLLKVYLVNNAIQVIHENSVKDFKAAVKLIKANCVKESGNWSKYYKFIEQFADFKYNHAITVHKSQGSTYKDVILNVGNISLNRRKEELRRLLYTGVTRASDLLILYNVK